METTRIESAKGGDRLKFFGAFLTRPTTVGAVAPSSRRLGREMIRGLDLDKADTVVELGPGTGAFTEIIIDSIGPNTTFFAVELNPVFARVLGRRFPSITVYNDSAENLCQHLKGHGKDSVSHVFCGLPWASLPLKAQERVFAAIIESLTPGGTFSTFAYGHACWFPNAVRFRRRLEQHFSVVKRSRTVWRNVPPAFIYRCTR